MSAPATSSEGLFVDPCAEVAGIHGYRTDEFLGWRRKRGEMGKPLYNIFVLQCVSCKAIDQRETKNVTEQPFCEKCYSPMVTKSVILNSKVFPVRQP